MKYLRLYTDSLGESHFEDVKMELVPLTLRLLLLDRYSAEEGRLHSVSRLGGTAWQRTKARTRKAIRDMAQDLLRIYAARKARAGRAFGPDTAWQHELESSFPYEETPDQDQAIEDVRLDMEAPRPMDRLICGDVGYGKTEVAMRGAFLSMLRFVNRALQCGQAKSSRTFPAALSTAESQ